MSQKYMPQEIADWLLSAVNREAGDSITHLKLQKLVYYAQAWALVMLDRPLFDEDFQAWAHGPVLRSLFDKYKGSSWNALPQPQQVPNLEPEVAELLHDIMESYGELSAKSLEEMTHDEAPWMQARGTLPPEAKSETVITKKAMKIYHKEELDSVNEQLKEVKESNC